MVVTFCYIEKDGKYLMLRTTKKNKDNLNEESWLGIGGLFEKGESPEECVIREVKKQTGLTLNTYKLRSIITHASTEFETEYMYVFTSNDFIGDVIKSNDGEFEWVDKKQLFELNVWDGDKIFLEKLQQDDKFFTVKFEYDGMKLTKYKLNEY